MLALGICLINSIFPWKEQGTKACIQCVNNVLYTISLVLEFIFLRSFQKNEILTYTMDNNEFQQGSGK